MRERLHDECASCRADIWVDSTEFTGLFTEHFCATCKIASVLNEIACYMESICMMMEERI